MSHALVTGATGFLGRPTVDSLLARGWRVTATSRRPPNDPRVQWLALDLRKDNIAKGIRSVGATHLLHLAWHVPPKEYLQSSENQAWANTSNEVIEAFLANGGRRVVSVGTCLEYDPDQGPCHERTTPLRPNTPYARAKLQHRADAQTACRQAGAGLAWPRMFHLFGPGEPNGRLVPSVLDALLKGHTAKCTKGTKIRDYLYAPDAADALVALLASTIEGDVNIASGEPTTVRDLVDRFAEHFPDARIDWGAIPEREGDSESITADVSRLRAELRWKPPTRPDAAVERTIEWFRTRSAP